MPLPLVDPDCCGGGADGVTTGLEAGTEVTDGAEAGCDDGTFFATTGCVFALSASYMRMAISRTPLHSSMSGTEKSILFPALSTMQSFFSILPSMEAAYIFSRGIWIPFPPSSGMKEMPPAERMSDPFCPSREAEVPLKIVDLSFWAISQSIFTHEFLRVGIVW